MSPDHGLRRSGPWWLLPSGSSEKGCWLNRTLKLCWDLFKGKVHSLRTSERDVCQNWPEAQLQKFLATASSSFPYNHNGKLGLASVDTVGSTLISASGMTRCDFWPETMGTVSSHTRKLWEFCKLRDILFWNPDSKHPTIIWVSLQDDYEFFLQGPQYNVAIGPYHLLRILHKRHDSFAVLPRVAHIPTCRMN